MPLDIFCDYVSDALGEEWNWEYFALIINEHGYNVGTEGYGRGTSYMSYKNKAIGNGNGYGYIENYGQIYGRENGIGEGYTYKMKMIEEVLFGNGKMFHKNNGAG
jgi:hypothetical protein